jgi:plastocyanin
MQVMRKIILLVVILVAGFSEGAVHAQQWGDLTGTFLYDDGKPQAAALKVTTDKEFCGKFNLLDESLIVNAQNGGIANVVAYVSLSPTDSPIPVHPSYQDTATASVKMDNNCCRFDPHVVLLRTTQKLIFGNSDDVSHNCKVDTLTNPPINYTVPPKGKQEQNFTMAERLPARVSCSIHPWMSGWLVIKDNPYMAVSDANGKLTIRNVPVGNWTFQFWHERAGYISNASQNGKPVEWKRGRVEIAIKAGVNDLGQIKVAAAAFADKK